MPGRKDRDVDEGVIARANPDGTHVGISAPVAIQQEGDPAVDEQRQHAHHAHDLGCGQCHHDRVPERVARYPQAKQAHADAFDDGGPRPPDEHQTEHG